MRLETAPGWMILTNNDVSRVRSDVLARLELQRDGAAGGGLPVQGGGRAGLEVVAAVRDVERVLLSSNNGRQGAHGEVQNRAHRD